MADDWFAHRVPAPPAALLELLRSYVSLDAPLPLALAEGGAAALRRAIEIGDDRAAAYPLLAADALFTYAVEAAAEQGSDTLEAVLETWGPERIWRLA